jgi:hypothetical protein
MRNNTRGQLVEMLRDECGISSNSSRGNDNLAYLLRVLKRHYEFLSDEYDWPFLRIDNDEATKELEAGERYYDFPITMDLESTLTADHFYGNVWTPLDYGIGPEEYTAMNPETGQRADPQLKWRIKDGKQFEVWPMPATNGNLIRFKGRRRITPLTSDDSICDLDDQLVVLYASAEVLAKKNQKDADLKLAAAKQRLIQTRAASADRRKVRVGMGYDDGQFRRGFPRIRAFPASN